MIEVHHLNNSRSQRVLWCLEELGLDYQIVKHQRDPQTNLAPDSLKAVHPLGKSPVVRDGGRVLIESGAILDYLVRRYGNGRLAPREGTPDHQRYVEWMHFAEGSAMLPVMLKLYRRGSARPARRCSRACTARSRTTSASSMPSSATATISSATSSPPRTSSSPS